MSEIRPLMHPIELMAGSLIVERYEYGTRSGGVGIQWLAEKVDKNGDLVILQACKTRREALQVIAAVPSSTRGDRE